MGKITKASQMSIVGNYKENRFSKKSLENLLNRGIIYEFKKGWFKKV